MLLLSRHVGCRTQVLLDSGTYVFAAVDESCVIRKAPVAVRAGWDPVKKCAACCAPSACLACGAFDNDLALTDAQASEHLSVWGNMGRYAPQRHWGERHIYRGPSSPLIAETGDGDPVLQLLREGADASLRTECIYVTSQRTARALFTARQIAMRKGLTECVAAFDTYRCDGGAGRFLPGVGAATVATDASSSGGAEGAAGSVPDEIVAAAWQSDDAAGLAWLDGGGRVDATFTRDGVSGNTLLMVAARILWSVLTFDALADDLSARPPAVLIEIASSLNSLPIRLRPLTALHRPLRLSCRLVALAARAQA